MHHTALLRLVAATRRALLQLSSRTIGFPGFAWSPPSQLRALAVAAFSAAFAASIFAQGPKPAPAGPDVKDTSKPKIREIVASVSWQQVSWDERRKRTIGLPLSIQFNAPAAPLKLVGKEAAPGTVKMTPEIPGVWKWANSQRLDFEPQGGWMPPREYEFQLGDGVFAPDCKVALKKATWHDWQAPSLTASFGDNSFYIDPATPAMQQAVATVTFSQPVTRDEVLRCLKVTNTSGEPLFAPGGKPQVIADEKNPLRFFLRSPLVKPGEKEDIIRFDLENVNPIAGGAPMPKVATTKITSPARYTGFFLKDARTQLVTNKDGEPRQFVFLESSIAANTGVVAKAVQAWELPPPPKDKDGKVKPWETHNVTDEVLAKSRKVALELFVEEGAPTTTNLFGFRLVPQQPARLFIQVPKETPAPGGFATKEDFKAIVDVPPFNKEAKILGRGGILALNGERKLNIESRGFSHLRYTVARVPAGQINHLVTQTNGRFETPGFAGDVSFENLAHFHSSVQDIVKKNDHEPNYSAFDFGPSLAKVEPGGEDAQRGLFYLEIEGVRKRTKDDAQPDDSDPDPAWIALAKDGGRRNRGEEDEEDQDVSKKRGSISGDSRFVLITDLGVIVKRNADGTREVFIQSFKERGPVAGTRIAALAKNGDTLAEATTDDQGRASLPALDGLLREKVPVAIIARKGADLAFIPWARSDRELGFSRFDVGGVQSSDATALDAALFTERGIYRPGDPIQLGAIVRQRNWGGSLTGVPVEVVVTNAKEEEAGRYPAKLPADGFIEMKLPTSETSPTGVWRIALRRADEGKKTKHRDDEEEGDPLHLGHILVRVEEFQPDRLKIAAKLDPEPKAAWLPPTGLTARAEVQTLFNLAAENRRVTAKLRIAPAYPNFEQWPGWTFGLPKHESFEQREVDLGEVKTDAEGRAQFALALDDYTAPLMRVAVDLEAFEADGGRGVRGSLGTLVSQQAFLMGYKPDGDLNFIQRNVPRSVQVVAIGGDAKPAAAPALKRVLIETRHVSVLTKQNNNTLAYVSREIEKELETIEDAIPAEAVKLALPVQRTGSFRYEWRDATGTVLFTLPFNVVGAGDADRNLERDSELELTLPDKVWKPGEQIQVSLRAPYSGAGLITIERDRVLAAQWFKSDTAASVQHITVPEGIEGGAYVNVAFVRALDSKEIFTSPLSTGVAPFRVTNERRQLAVTLDAPERARPGEKVRIGFTTPRASRVVIWAVDDGIHRVTSYKAPNPLASLIRKPSLEVGTWQLLDLLLPEFTLLKNSKAFGGDGDEPPELKLGLNPFKRRRAAPVVFWSGIVEAGPERREVFYDVPDYFAGRLNIMAAAVAPDAVGVAEKHTIVKGPFVLTPNTPFFTTPGDEFTASLTVANQLEGDAVTDKVTLSAEKIGGLEIIESPENPVTIPVGKEATVRFRVRTTDALGNAELKFSASAGNERISQSATMSVRPASPRIAVVQSGWTRKDAHDVKLVGNFHSEFSKREAVVSTTPLGLARGLASYLREYPHGCSEQITSRAFPWLVLREDAAFGLDRAEAEKAIRDTIAMLRTRQQKNGGFGYWSHAGDDEGLDYVSVYVAHFLAEAKAAGFAVPAPMFDASLRRLRFMADEKLPDPWRDEHGRLHYDQTRHDADIQAAAIYLLTRNEEVTTNYALKMRDFLDAKVPKELWQRDPSAAFLASTWRLLKKDDEAKKLITAHRTARAEEKRVKREDWWSSYYYSSPLTREAVTFTLLCRHFPEVAGTLGYDDLRPITEAVERGEFHTLSAAWTVMALKSYSALVKDAGVRAGIAEIVNGEAKQVLAPLAGMQAGKIAPNAATVRFLIERKDGAGGLGAWYQTIETGFERALAAEPDSRGLEVVREILDEGDNVIDTAKVGETLRIRVTIRNVSKSAQANLALSELLPGAFDLAPASEAHALRPGLGTIQGAEYVDVREDRALLFCNLGEDETRTFEYSVRPTCAGTFSVPPSLVESMYDRTVRGRGVAGKFTVVPRE